jgi:hypothetical protein
MGWKKSYWEGVGAWFSKVDSILQDFVDNKKGMSHQMGGESNLVELHWKFEFYWFFIDFFLQNSIFPNTLGPKNYKIMSI